ncbi:MAG: hypothetical protein GX556_18075 [Fibrobacter sp.]|nr:hypothetical protein [Fibrobacter sp.]
MKKFSGIAATPDGFYVSATLNDAGGNWKLTGTSKWQIYNKQKSALLLDKSVCLGIESKWVRTFPKESGPWCSASGEYFTACTQPAHHQLHAEILDNNINGIFPDDAFLCTLPLNLLKDPEDSFISVYQKENDCRIGITLNRKLTAVFHASQSDFSNLQYLVARIERYWITLNTGMPFPDTIYTFNRQKIFSDGQFSVRSINTLSEDPSVIKAIGAAFCHTGNNVPAFSGPSSGIKFRKIRKAALITSLILVAVPLISFAVLFSLNQSTISRVKKCKADYNNIIANNTEIKELLKSGESLAKKHIRLQRIATNQTDWGRFLYHLGSSRPDGLFFERLGSEPMPGDAEKVRIALSGWAGSETIVTEMIKKLSVPGFITNVSLSSLERDEKQKDYCRFKVICTLNF